MKILKIIILLLFLASGEIKAQLQFHLDYSYNVKEMIAASSGGFYMLVTIYDSLGIPGTQITKVDDNLNLLWAKIIFGANIVSIFQGSNGNLFMTGTAVNDSFALAIKTDSLANIQWSKHYKHYPFPCSGVKILEHSSGDIYLLANAIDAFGLDTANIYLLLKLDSLGNFIWAREPGTQYGSIASELIEDSDSSLICGTVQYSLNGSYGNSFKVFSSGTLGWWNLDMVGNAMNQHSGEIDDLLPLPGGGCALAGVIPIDLPLAPGPAFKIIELFGNSGASGKEAQYVLLDSIGYAWSFYNIAMVRTFDGGYVLSGNTNAGNYLQCLFKVDSNLTPQWFRLYYGSTGKTFLFQLQDHGFLIASGTSLIRADSLGRTFCNESILAVTVSATGPDAANPYSYNPGGPQFLDFSYLISDTAIYAGDWDTLCYNFSNSINKIADNFSFIIYPNPASNQFTVNSKQDAITTIEIFNLLGENIYTAMINGEQFNVNCEHFPEGVYFVNIVNEYGEKTTVKVAVVH